MSKESFIGKRFDSRGELRLMAQADGYAMVRRPGCMPFVMSFSDWLKLEMKSSGNNFIESLAVERRIRK